MAKIRLMRDAKDFPEGTFKSVGESDFYVRGRTLVERVYIDEDRTQAPQQIICTLPNDVRIHVLVELDGRHAERDIRKVPGSYGRVKTYFARGLSLKVPENI